MIYYYANFVIKLLEPQIYNTTYLKILNKLLIKMFKSVQNICVS